MTSAQNGRLCSSCNKVVIDFTNLSDAEVLAVIQQSSAKLCGRFTDAQLNRPLTPQKQHQNSIIPAVMLTSALIAGGTASSPAQNPDPNMQTAQLVTMLMKDGAGQPLPTDSIPGSAARTEGFPVASGKVLDHDYKEALQYVNVLIKNTNRGTVTDKDGNFRLRIPDSMGIQDVTLVFYSLGFDKQELKLTEARDPRQIEISMKQTHNVLTGDIIIIDSTARKPTFWRKVKNLFRRKA